MKLTLAAALLGAALLSAPGARADEDPAAGAFDSSASLDGRWKEKLGFTDEQFKKYSAAEKAKEDALRPLRGKLRDALEKIRDLVAAKAPDKDVGAALDALASVRQGIARADERYDADLATFLTPTQRAKMLVGTPVGDSAAEGAADPRASELHQALTDGDAEQE